MRLTGCDAASHMGKLFPNSNARGFHGYMLRNIDYSISRGS